MYLKVFWLYRNRRTPNGGNTAVDYVHIVGTAVLGCTVYTAAPMPNRGGDSSSTEYGGVVDVLPLFIF